MRCDTQRSRRPATAGPRGAASKAEGRCSADDERALCDLDQPKAVCLRVTLNDDPMQHSDDCVPFTYFDE